MPSGAALIHNDYKLDNVVFDAADPRRLMGVLDWEMATVGDPLMDLGCSLSYWVQADDPPWLHETALVPTAVPGSLTRRQVLARYAASCAPAIAARIQQAASCNSFSEKIELSHGIHASTR